MGLLAFGDGHRRHSPISIGPDIRHDECRHERDALIQRQFRRKRFKANLEGNIVRQKVYAMLQCKGRKTQNHTVALDISVGFSTHRPQRYSIFTFHYPLFPFPFPYPLFTFHFPLFNRHSRHPGHSHRIFAPPSKIPAYCSSSPCAKTPILRTDCKFFPVRAQKRPFCAPPPE